MKGKLRYISKFIEESVSAKDCDAKTSYRVNKAAKRCIEYFGEKQRSDLKTEHFEAFESYLLGVFSSIISYQESVTYLCLAGHGLNSTVLLRSQLEAYLLFNYLIEPQNDLAEIEKRVDEYKDWVMIKMYLNSNKSKQFELFNTNASHTSYLTSVEENYNFVKEKYKDDPLFNDLKKRQSFVKDKLAVARNRDIEDLYQAIFSESSATVHLADISDRMTPFTTKESDGYIYEFSSKKESPMIISLSNVLLINSIVDFILFFEFEESIKEKIFGKKLLKQYKLS